MKDIYKLLEDSRNHLWHFDQDTLLQPVEIVILMKFGYLLLIACFISYLQVIFQSLILQIQICVVS